MKGTVLGLWLLLLAACAHEPLRLGVDPASGNVTIRARCARLSEILDLLRRNGIEVIASDLRDRRVTIAADDRPVREVLAQLVPKDTRLWIRGERADAIIPGTRGDQRGRRAPRRDHLPRKGDDVTRPPMNQSPRRGERMKEPPEVRAVSEHPRPKTRPEPLTPGRFMRVRLTMTERSVSIEDAFALPGELVPDSTLAGDFVWALESEGTVLAVGSFRDPLEMHAYVPDRSGRHEMLRAESGSVTVSLPEAALERLRSSRLAIYRVARAPSTHALTIETFPRLRGALRELYAIHCGELSERR